jgi:hypothetical protein
MVEVRLELEDDRPSGVLARGNTINTGDWIVHESALISLIGLG